MCTRLPSPQALVIRAGWGEGEQVAYGRWMHARELPLEHSRRRTLRPRPGAGRARSAALRPQERLAALLGARSDALLCEELALRARLDLDQGRPIHAAIELDSALAAARARAARRGAPGPRAAHRRARAAARRASPRRRRSRARACASRPRGEDDATPTGARQLDEDVLRHGLERLEAALRARSAAGFNLK